MKEKLEILTFKHRIILLTFILFLVIGLLTPLGGSDWNSYVIGKQGIIECFNNINIRDGRLISSFLTNFFSYNRLLFVVVFSLLMSSFVKICTDLMGTVKNKFMYLYPLIGILLVSTFMFAFNYASVTGAVCYTLPTILFFIYFYILLKHDDLNIKKYIMLIIYAIIIMGSSIHLALTFFITNLIHLILTSNKNNRLKYTILLLIQFAMLIINVHFLESVIIYTKGSQILNNIPYFIDTLFSNNIVIMIIGAIPINYYLGEKLKDNKYCRVVITLFDLVLLFSLSYNFFNYSPVNLNLVINKYNGTFATENWYYIIYFIMYIVLFFMSINHFIKTKKIKRFLNVFNIASVIMAIFVLISPLFDKGNIIIIVLSIILMSCIIASELDIKVYVRFTLTVAILLVVYYLSMFAISKYVDVTRTNYIKEQIEAKDTSIEIKANPILLIWRYNPNDLFLEKNFKKYYEIPEDNTIEVKYFGIFEKIERKVKQ